MTDTQTTPTETAPPEFPSALTLKNIKVHHGLSEETWAYTATVYLDGKSVGTVKNDGHGGPDFHTWKDKAAGERALAIGKEYDPQAYGGIEVLFGDLLNEHMLRQECKRTHRKGYRYAVLAGASMYGFNDRANIAPAMLRDGVSTYRVVEA